jgi:hypothetical protein
LLSTRIPQSNIRSRSANGRFDLFSRRSSLTTAEFHFAAESPTGESGRPAFGGAPGGSRGRRGGRPVQRHGRGVAPRLDQIALDHYPCACTVVYLSFRFQVSSFKSERSSFSNLNLKLEA